MRKLPIPHLIDLDEMIAHSYRDFHAKGLDYLCLRRTPERTVKIYFFEGDVRRAPEVVIPHDHRYHFWTTVASGSVLNRTYGQVPTGIPGTLAYERFEYRTPLNGGSGFAWSGTEWLNVDDQQLYSARDSYFMRAEQIHTIRIVGTETILMLDQGEDVVERGAPTRAFRRGGREPPSLEGLYRPMDADHAIKRLEQLFAVLKRNGRKHAA